MKKLALALTLAVAACASAPTATPAPRAKSPQECVVLADMALVAAANARHGIDQVATLDAMPDIYGPFIELRREEGLRLVRLVVRAAYRAMEHRASMTPADFGSALGTGCMQRQGDLQPILGEEV